MSVAWQIIFSFAAIICFMFNFAVILREFDEDNEYPVVVILGVLMVSMMPPTLVVTVFYVARRWFRRHWEIVKIERDLRAK